jgi:DNA-binding transcriptional ArsR family regulator
MAYGIKLTALADPTRRAVFERLRGGPVSVGEIAAGLPVSRPAVSQHLKVLKDAGLVRDEAHGARRLYEVDPNGLGELRAWLDRFWDESLNAFKAEVERPSQPEESEERKKPR